MEVPQAVLLTSKWAIPFFIRTPPLIEGPGFLRGRGVFNCVGTCDLLINPEGGVCQHFDI